MWDKRPADWPVRKLSELATRVDRRNGGGNHPVMTISAKHGFLLQSEKYSREMAGQSLERYIELKSGEFAYNKGNSNTAPQGCIFRLDLPTALVPFVYYCFSLGSELDPEYASCAFKGGILNRELARVINSGVRNDGLLNLYAADFFNCRFAVPPFYEQVAIADVLKALEDCIAKSNNVLANIGRAKHATMRELLTRGVGRQKARMKPLPERWVLGRVAEGIKEIPVKWDLVRLTSIAKLESGHTPDRKKSEYWDGNIPWISLQDADALSFLTIGQTAETIGPEGLANSSARMLPAETVVLQRTANVGLCSIMDREMCTSQHFVNWICSPRLHPQYLQQVFRHMEREWLRLVAGSVLPDIYMDTFKKLQILLPPFDEQVAIAELGAAFDLRIERERALLLTLRASLAALSQELLSGRVRLPETMIARHRDKRGRAA